MPLWTDNFNDNVLDTSKWETVIFAGGVVSEVDQHLVCTASLALDAAGVVSKIPYDLTTCDLSVYMANSALEQTAIVISLTKVTDAYPYGEADLYMWRLYNQTDRCILYRCVGGEGANVYDQPWTLVDGTMRITIDAGTIKFYERGVERYSEAYALGSYQCYAYLWAKAGAGTTGSDVFDDFSLDYYAPPAGGGWTRKWGGSHHGFW